VKQRIRGISGLEELLVSGWEMCAGPSPDGPWIPAGPTVAAGLRTAGAWSLDAPVRRFDAEDWWFRARLPSVEAPEIALCCDGLATLAEVFLDGKPLFTSDNMFLAHEHLLPAGGGGELTIHFRSLDAALGAKRPRPRWRAPMIENQQLRWFRTTLLGRTPGWSPPAAAVGPWRPVRIEQRTGVAVDSVWLQARPRDAGGEVEVIVRARSLGAPLEPAELIVERSGETHRAPITNGHGCVILPQVTRWWPHTHGEPALYRARLRLGQHEVDLGHIGFREVTRDGDFSLAINGVPIFCRGACWTPLDPVTLTSDRAALATALTQARDAGMNMLRVGGTMVYESDDFYDLCDELGILVWQDFMFANMDYPEDDAAFAESVATEVRQIAARLQARPSLAVLCGNSEGEQQAAMFGAPRERWSPKLFHETLPQIAREFFPDVPYWPSSAHGGAFPHQADVGTTSYYGVGAYLRPLEDARRAEVRFASECLAFANVPRTVSPSVRVHHPAWKARTPRDLGAGWDFDDVRDHYVERLFGVNALELRYADHDRYLQLGRAATGEVMAAVFGEWRRRRSTCRGGLVWFLRDLWAGAGWGVIDAAGVPKSAYWYLRRALAPVAAHLSDEGGNGVTLHLVNDRPRALAGELELSLFRAGEVAVGGARRAVEIPPHGSIELPAAALLDGFSDLTWAYRFGPPAQDLIVATLREAGVVAAQAFHFPVGRPRARELDLGLTAEHKDGALTVRTRRFAQAIAIDAEGFAPADDWFHLPPGSERTIAMPRVSGSGAPRGTLQPLNCEAATKIAFQ
jgi:beta-mannosidase